MNQADRVFVQPKTYHQRGETNYDTRRVTIQVRRGRKQERDDRACWIAGLSGPCRSNWVIQIYSKTLKNKR